METACPPPRSVGELNRLAGFPQKTVHVVIKKDETDWLASMLNWGLRCGWFGSKEAALCSTQEFRQDYFAYYDFWKALERSEPRLVRVLDLEEIQVDTSILVRSLTSLGIELRSDNKLKGVFSEVPHSPRARKKEIVRRDVESFISSNGSELKNET